MLETIESLRKSLPYRSLSVVGGPHKQFKHPPKSKRLTVWGTGGLGDALLSMNLVEAIRQYIGEEPIFYSRYPEIVSMFSTLDVRDEKEFIHVGADYWITLNTLVLFNFQHNFRGFENPKVEELFLNYSAFRSKGDWKFIIDRQPFMENRTGIEATKLGFTRQTLTFEILGLPHKELRKPKAGHARVLDEPYITIHTGFDEANDTVIGRSTKNWQIGRWNQVVANIHKTVPQKVIQLGGKTSQYVSGVDYNLIGRTSLTEAMEILGGSRLHLDGESGLVHASHMLGVKSIVLFGPTSVPFFSYPDNINLVPKVCNTDGHGCWWLKATPSWTAKCPVGYVAPMCIDSITTEEVCREVQKELTGECYA